MEDCSAAVTVQGTIHYEGTSAASRAAGYLQKRELAGKCAQLACGRRVFQINNPSGRIFVEQNFRHPQLRVNGLPMAGTRFQITYQALTPRWMPIGFIVCFKAFCATSVGRARRWRPRARRLSKAAGGGGSEAELNQARRRSSLSRSCSQILGNGGGEGGGGAVGERRGPRR
jgi:hypothetical protein